MIIVRTIHGKRHVFETNARGDIVTKDGETVEHLRPSLDDVRKKHYEAQKEYTGLNTGFMQRGNNKRR